MDSVSTQEKNGEKVVKTQSFKVDKKKGKQYATESSVDKEGAPLIKIQGDEKTSTKQSEKSGKKNNQITETSDDPNAQRSSITKPLIDTLE